MLNDALGMSRSHFGFKAVLLPVYWIFQIKFKSFYSKQGHRDLFELCCLKFTFLDCCRQSDAHWEVNYYLGTCCIERGQQKNMLPSIQG